MTAGNWAQCLRRSVRLASVNRYVLLDADIGSLWTRIHRTQASIRAAVCRSSPAPTSSPVKRCVRTPKRYGNPYLRLRCD
jgi:hypothetical protein